MKRFPLCQHRIVSSHDMHTLSALLVTCVGNPPIAGGYQCISSTNRPAKQSFEVLFFVSLNILLNKQSKGRSNKTHNRLCDVTQIRPHDLVFIHRNMKYMYNFLSSLISYTKLIWKLANIFSDYKNFIHIYGVTYERTIYFKTFRGSFITTATHRIYPSLLYHEVWFH